MDEFTITIPRERAVLRLWSGLVVGGIAARHEVTLDVLDDLQLALDGLLERTTTPTRAGSTIESCASRAARSRPPSARSTRDDAAELEEDAGDALGLRRLLETVVDSVALDRAGRRPWVEFRRATSWRGASD